MIRFIPFLMVVFNLFCSILLFWLLSESAFFGWVSLILILILARVVFDFMQRKFILLRNYPLIGRLRFLFKEICPHIRQYFIEAEDDQVPFSHQQHLIIITGRCWAIDVDKKAKSSAQFLKTTRQALAKLVGVTDLYTSIELIKDILYTVLVSLRSCWPRRFVWSQNRVWCFQNQYAKISEYRVIGLE